MYKPALFVESPLPEGKCAARLGRGQAPNVLHEVAVSQSLAREKARLIKSAGYNHVEGRANYD